MRALAGRAGAWWAARADGERDSLLYLVSAAFALGFALQTHEFAHRQWAWLALPGYVIAAPLARWAGNRGAAARMRLTGFVILAAAVLPLIVEVRWRHAGLTASAQPEVEVIERTGQLLSQGQSPYQSYYREGVLVHGVPGRPEWLSFFPYLPLMAVFGLPAAGVDVSTLLSDARVAMTVATMTVAVLALWCAPVLPGVKVRLAQILLALPTGAVFLATGGDDMPVLALMLLAVVAWQRGWWAVSATALGLAASLKLTAWPLALAVLAAGIVTGQRNARRTAGLTGLIVAAAVTPFVLRDPRAVMANVLAYPLGLTGASSPAASALPGHLLHLAAPDLTPMLLAAAVVVWGVVHARWLRRTWPPGLAQCLTLSGSGMLLLMCAAPATRFGYLIYPVNLAAWAHASAQTTTVLEPRTRVRPRRFSKVSAPGGGDCAAAPNFGHGQPHLPQMPRVDAPVRALRGRGGPVRRLPRHLP